MGYISKEDYRETVQKVMRFLSGYDDTAEKLIEERMNAAVGREEFERAIVYRDQLAMLKKTARTYSCKSWKRHGH